MDDEKFDLNSRIWVWFNSVLSYDNIIAHDFLNEIDGCATFADVIIGLAATLAAAAAAAAALIYRRRHAYPDPVPAGGEDDGYEEDAHEREYRDDRYPDGYDRDPYGYDDGYRDSYRDRY